MHQGTLFQLSSIIILGILAQCLAWRLRLPSIILLLAAGVTVGPLTGMLKPDHLFGDLLLPVVSLSVAVILYEGGLNLQIRELRKLNITTTLFAMTTVGLLVSWIIGAFSGYFILDLSWQVATLLGAILVVTGPTVIGPMLRHIRLFSRVGVLLKWEGIVVDPMGAILAVLIFTVVQAGNIHEGVAEAAISLCWALAAGVSLGCLAAGILILALWRFWIPDSLHNPVALMLILSSYAAANSLQHESGLLAAAVMGIVLANQKRVPIRHVLEFGETLTVLLISSLFVILAARLQREDILVLGRESFIFVAVMMFIARPVSVLVATVGSSLTWRERCFMSFMAPRGIVAAAVSSVFALNLLNVGYPRAIDMVSITFLMVIVSVVVYGILGGPLARKLGLVHGNAQGILFVGAHEWARALASALQKEGCPVMLIDTSWENIGKARMAGLPCYHGSALAETTREEIDFSALGRLLAVTSNNAVNALASLIYSEDFGRQEVYQLSLPSSQAGRHERVPWEHRGRFLFGKDLTYRRLGELFGSPPSVKSTKLSAEFGFEAYQANYGDTAIPLFILKPDGFVQVCASDVASYPQAGDMIIGIVSEGCQNSQESDVPLTDKP